MRQVGDSWLTPACRIEEAARRRFVVARQALPVGTLVAVFGGRVVDLDTLRAMPPARRRYAIQVEEGLYQVSMHVGLAEQINHSCDPNLGFRGPVSLFTRRPVAAGEQVTFDYAMCDGTPFDEFECHCGARTCRGRVTGEDWRRPELWRRYPSEMSPYLAGRIRQLIASTRVA